MPGHLTGNASQTRNSKRCNPTDARGVVLEKEICNRLFLRLTGVSLFTDS
jgi:hypothetical protein